MQQYYYIILLAFTDHNMMLWTSSFVLAWFDSNFGNYTFFLNTALVYSYVHAWYCHFVSIIPPAVNNLSSLYCSIGQLTSLQILEIGYNLSLTTLPESLFSISSLYISCAGCEALKSPPYAVCYQGVRTVRKYFFDLKVEAGSNQHLILWHLLVKARQGKPV